VSRNKDIGRIKKVYDGMLERCNNVNHISHKFYGAKGVKVACSRADFVKWYLENVTEEMIKPSVDRIDTNGDYTLKNMRIVPLAENSQKARLENTSVFKLQPKERFNTNGHLIYIDGRLYRSLQEAQRATGINNKAMKIAINKYNCQRFDTGNDSMRLIPEKNQTIIVPKNSNEKLAIGLSEKEFKCKCKDDSCRATIISSNLIHAFSKMREKFGQQVIINSGFRCMAHNWGIEPRGSALSRHTTGEAIDLSIKPFGDMSFNELNELLVDSGFTFIKVYDKFVHVDTRPLPPSRISELWR
jgi:hypothetical protein